MGSDASSAATNGKTLLAGCLLRAQNAATVSSSATICQRTLKSSACVSSADDAKTGAGALTVEIANNEYIN